MKKRKIYEISVIDKTYSKTISDETKFYTSDTALELVFKLKETEYTFESAEIVLLNIDDRSLVTRPVSKVLDSFTYELEDDIIPHYGEWRGQLRFEQAGEIYVSSPVKFRIENDLSNDRPPQLSDVQSWVSLKRYADGLIEELKQAVLSIEGIEDTFNANESERQSQFASAEQSRQTTFETNESERDETFNTNETTRQSQELEREKAEGTRQTVFDDNESSRFETFNTNEATRQENETTRQQAESQRQSTFETNETERQTTFETAEQERQSAELVRVENEKQRKIDHANRSVELDGKADKVVINNLVEKGNFIDGEQIVGVRPINSSRDLLSIENGRLKVTSATYVTDLGFFIRHVTTPKGHKVYLYTSIDYPFSTPQNVVIRATVPSVFTFLDSAYTSGENSQITTTNADTDNFYFTLNGNKSEVENYYYVNSIMILDLTETFGAGNEPTKVEMDELIKVTGYINNEYALNNKEMLIWTLALIRRNKNAIITLGGTI